MTEAFARRDIWTLETTTQPWDETTRWYAIAVREMMGRQPNDPTGWTYQAAIHGIVTSSPLPGWQQCQHGSWYFFPWHRMYLWYFERIVRKIIIDKGGPANWALPYWNYSRGGDTAALPPAFRQVNWTPPEGGQQPNPLYTARRSTANPNINGGEKLPDTVVAFEPSLAILAFSTPVPQPSFGGPQTGFQHTPLMYGALESQPHNPVHVFVGRGGLMTDPNLAALDPIFWLHHANIDRLWEVWLSRGGGRANPTEAAWLNQEFTFFDETGAAQKIRVSDVTDIGRLQYRYEDAPGGAGAPTPYQAAAAGAERESGPQLLAASTSGINLTGEGASVGIPLGAEARQVVEQAAVAGAPQTESLAAEAGEPTQPAGGPPPTRFYLVLEGMAAQGAVGEVYQVHVKPTEEASEEFFVGNVTFFGAQPHSGGDIEHPTGPLSQSFDITDVVQRLRDTGSWSPDRVAVRLRPLSQTMGSTAQERAHPPATIQRISIFQH